MTPTEQTARVRCQMCMRTADVHAADVNRWYETHTCTPDEVNAWHCEECGQPGEPVCRLCANRRAAFAPDEVNPDDVSLESLFPQELIDELAACAPDEANEAET